MFYKFKIWVRESCSLALPIPFIQSKRNRLLINLGKVASTFKGCPDSVSPLELRDVRAIKNTIGALIQQLEPESNPTPRLPRPLTISLVDLVKPGKLMVVGSLGLPWDHSRSPSLPEALIMVVEDHGWHGGRA